MNNAELITALRWCGSEDERHEMCVDETYRCPMWNEDRITDECKADLMLAAADALEAAEKRIAELEARLPKRGEWIEKWRFKTDGTPFHKIGDMECSVCHGDMLGRYYSKYCPHCGALLRGENDERTDKA